MVGPAGRAGVEELRVKGYPDIHVLSGKAILSSVKATAATACGPVLREIGATALLSISSLRIYTE